VFMSFKSVDFGAFDSCKEFTMLADDECIRGRGRGGGYPIIYRHFCMRTWRMALEASDPVGDSCPQTARGITPTQ